MRHWEINGNLDGSLSNYEAFSSTVTIVKCKYDSVFGIDVMNKIDFLVHNATRDSGYTPICTPVLKKIVIIKLGISPTDGVEKIAYQFAHELTHVVFRAYCGWEKPMADIREENICSAASLIIIKELFPASLCLWNNYVRGLSDPRYQGGYNVAVAANYSLDKLKDMIESLVKQYSSER